MVVVRSCGGRTRKNEHAAIRSCFIGNGSKIRLSHKLDIEDMPTFMSPESMASFSLEIFNFLLTVAFYFRNSEVQNLLVII